MNETICELRRHRREGQSALAGRVYSGKCVSAVAGPLVIARGFACAAAETAPETSVVADSSAPAISLWRLSLAGGATDRSEIVAFVLLAVGSAVSLLNGFGRLDHFLTNWPTFVELVQRVFS